ncbi:MAG: DUF2748 family protein [Rickettsiaceae bacterium]|nr:DUF2748 family protein [Rickettsiaceae bacterium]
MTSVYHILDKHPLIYAEDLEIEYETLAQELVASGRLRIDTDYYCNFVRFSDAAVGINLMFSIEELTNPEIVKLTKQTLKRRYQRRNKNISDKKLSSIMIDLNNKVSKLLAVTDELKIRLARIFVQSAHPIVIRWILLDRVEVFITYSNSIGDVMDMQNWKRSGQNSGMQSTDGSNVCIYVSCGGDPFAKNREDHPIYGDGWAAAARMQVIAGQEIGHFADIKRDSKGRQISRHSANFAGTEATPHVRQGRLNDITRCDKLLADLAKAGMAKIIAIEEQLKFYDDNKVSNLKTFYLKNLAKYHRHKFLQYADKNKLHFIKRFAKEKYMGLMIRMMILDMKTHLTPIADVYRRDNKEEEEAISCIEALARVPQQVMKWGYLTTRATMHDLYHVYYKEVIPSLIKNYTHVTGKPYKRNYAKPPRKTSLQKFLEKFGFTKEKKFKFTEVRDIV